jgi:Tfp pilus assembly protein PilZ
MGKVHWKVVVRAQNRGGLGIGSFLGKNKLSYVIQVVVETKLNA